MSDCKDYRKGADIKVIWDVTINDGETVLADADLKVVLTDSMGRKQVVSHTIADDKIVFIYYGTKHGALGKYRCTLWVNYGKEGQAAVDHVDVFRLVPLTTMIDGSASDSDNVHTEQVIEIEDSIAVSGRGYSAYEIWLQNGHTGTEEDFISWIQSPATSAATAAEIAANNAENSANSASNAATAAITATEEATAATAAANTAATAANEAAEHVIWTFENVNDETYNDR